MRKHFIVGTAGHVDHGKTSLIRALTGMETDRLPEEKNRGLSIDLGFAHLALPGDIVVGIVDVPGHQRFLKNMLAGVGGYDLGLLVVDAQEGVMPQTREHVEILELLHTPQGLVAITKADLVDNEFLQLVIEELDDFLKDTIWAQAPKIPVSSKTGAGLAQLKQSLANQLRSALVRTQQGGFRLPIDRVFSKPGFGTVVTGSLWSGSLKKGALMQLWPAGQEVRARGLQAYGHETEVALAGQRVAINLSGVDLHQVKRGMLLSTPAWLSPTWRCDVRLHCSPHAPQAIKNRCPVRIYHGCAEIFGRALLLNQEELAPGASGLVQLVLDSPLVMLPQDRLILRDKTSSYTIGGAQVLEPLAQIHKRNDPLVQAQLQHKETGGIQQRLLSTLQDCVSYTVSQLATQMQISATEAEASLQQLQQAEKVVWLGKGWAQKASLEQIHQSLVTLLKSSQEKFPWKSGWRKEELLKQLKHPQARFAEECMTYLIEHEQLQSLGRLLSLPGYYPRLTPEQEAVVQRVRQRLLNDDFSPPLWPQLAVSENINPDLWKTVEAYLLETGQIQKIAPDLGLLTDTLNKGQEILSQLPAPFTASQARDILKSSRKFVIPLLEYYDRIGFTQRQGEVRRLRQSQATSGQATKDDSAFPTTPITIGE